MTILRSIVRRSSKLAAHSRSLVTRFRSAGPHLGAFATGSRGIATHSRVVSAHSGRFATHIGGLAEHSRSLVNHASGLLLLLAGTVPFGAVASAGGMSSTEVRPPLEYRIEEVSITLARGSCHDNCPVYALAIHGNGTVFYYGQEHVRSEGEHVGYIMREHVVRLLDAFYAARFTDLLDRYLSDTRARVNEDGVVSVIYRGDTGSPRSILTLRIGAYAKQVVSQPEYAPTELVELADLVDEVARSSQWTGNR